MISWYLTGNYTYLLVETLFKGIECYALGNGHYQVDHSQSLAACTTLFMPALRPMDAALFEIEITKRLTYASAAEGRVTG